MAIKFIPQNLLSIIATNKNILLLQQNADWGNDFAAHSYERRRRQVRALHWWLFQNMEIEDTLFDINEHDIVLLENGLMNGELDNLIYQIK